MVELASIVVLGILAQWLAWRLKVPAILPLILIGLAVGPFSTFWNHGEKWLNPIYSNGSGLFPGDNLFYFVELAIGIILFEGGLTLKRNEIKNIGPIILKLITVGSAVTFIGAALVVHFLLNLSWPLSFLFSGLIIVTGPTVIAPILRNIPLKKDVANILKWEGILIDPIGALVAVLVYEFIASLAGDHGGGHGDTSFTVGAFKHFLTLALVGFSLGTICAVALREVIKRHWVPHYLLNVFTLAIVLMVFVGSGLLVPDSGLLTIVVMGTVLANIEVPNMEEILYFKESLAVLLISMLFILLAANINISELELLLNWQSAAVFLLIILVLRPLGVFLSALNSPLSQNEKLFISWVGPRGIVAAGIASLFGNKLVAMNQAAEVPPFPGAELITPLVFMIVLGTVLLNATTAGIIAKLLGVMITKSSGILIIGANKANRLIAKYLLDNNQEVALIDSNKTNIDKASEIGIPAFVGNVYSEELFDNLSLNQMGYLMAMTGSSDVNKYAQDKYRSNFGENGSYRFLSPDEITNQQTEAEGGLFSKRDDYINFNEVARDYPNFHEIEVETAEDVTKALELINQHEKSIPLFFKDAESQIKIIEANVSTEAKNNITQVVYLGKKLEEVSTQQQA